METQCQRNILDLVKYVLSFFIVAIHCSLFGGALLPWLRIAVPLFFIISSFLLCERMEQAPENGKWLVLKRYLKRNIILYLFWFIVLLPFTIYSKKDMFDSNVLLSIWRVLSNILFSSSFPVSWFIIGCIYGSIVVFVLRKKHIIFSIILIVSLYTLTCLFSSYSFLIDNNEGLSSFESWYITIFTSPQCSFPIAISWMLLGQIIFKAKIVINKPIHYIIVSLCLLVSFVALYLEWFLVASKTNIKTFDVYFALLPICSFMFILLKDIKLKLKYSSILRKISTITFVLHMPIISLLHFLCKQMNIQANEIVYSVIAFFIAIVITHIVTFIILKLEKIPKLKFLRFSH